MTANEDDRLGRPAGIPTAESVTTGLKDLRTDLDLAARLMRHAERFDLGIVDQRVVAGLPPFTPAERAALAKHRPAIWEAYRKVESSARFTPWLPDTVTHETIERLNDDLEHYSVRLEDATVAVASLKDDLANVILGVHYGKTFGTGGFRLQRMRVDVAGLLHAAADEQASGASADRTTAAANTAGSSPRPTSATSTKVGGVRAIYAEIRVLCRRATHDLAAVYALRQLDPSISLNMAKEGVQACAMINLEAGDVIHGAKQLEQSTAADQISMILEQMSRNAEATVKATVECEAAFKALATALAGAEDERLIAAGIQLTQPATDRTLVLNAGAGAAMIADLAAQNGSD